MRAGNPNNHSARARGFNTIEVIVAMALAVGLLALILQIFVTSKQSSVVQDAAARLQENARIALDRITEDVRHAGFMGEIQEYWNVDVSSSQNIPNAVTGECFNDVASGKARWLAPFVSVGSSPPLIPPKLFGDNGGRSNFTGCIATQNYKSGTDVLSVHYVGPASGPDSTFGVTANGYFMRANLFNGLVFKSDGTAPPSDSGSSWTDGPNTRVYPLQAMVYYVRPCLNPGGNNLCGDSGDDTIPSLVRSYLNSSGVMQTDVVAEGVESFQVRYGVDTTTSKDGIVNRYVDASNALLGDPRDTARWDEWALVRTVRVWILLRSNDKFAGHVDTKTYTLGDVAVTPTAGYRYQLYSSTVAIRNASGDE